MHQTPPTERASRALSGLSLRPYAGHDDIPAMVELYREVNRAHGVTEVRSVERERIELDHASNVDPREDYLLAFVGDELAASSSIGWADTTDGQRLYWSRGWVHPTWRRQGIGSAMLTRNEGRLAELATGHAHGMEPALMTWLDDADAGGRALFAARGYEQVRLYHHMVRPDLDDIDVPPLPPGLEVRSVTREQLPRLWQAAIEAFRDHFGGHDHTPEAYERWALDPDLDPSLFVVAFDDDEIAGGVFGIIVALENRLNGYRRGWADPVFTRRAWRRRGLASALLGRALVLLRERGMTSAQLDVDTANANDALSLYRRHGFETEHASSEWHKPLIV